MSSPLKKTMIPIGVPQWVPSEDPKAVCPRCMASLCEVQVKVLVGSQPASNKYLGCPACAYVSQALIEYMEAIDGDQSSD